MLESCVVTRKKSENVCWGQCSLTCEMVATLSNVNNVTRMVRMQHVDRRGKFVQPLPPVALGTNALVVNARLVRARYPFVFLLGIVPRLCSSPHGCVLFT